MEAKYYRNYTNSYLILTAQGEDIEKGYSCKMLLGGKVEGLLKCSVRHINSTTCLYYDISSKIALQQMYVRQKMSRAQICDMLEQLHGILEGVHAFFMEESHILLEPEYLYYDMDQKKWLCVYDPGYERTQPPLMPLMEFLLEHADMEDQELADALFQMYELAEKGSFSVEELYMLIENGEEKEEKWQESAEAHGIETLKTEAFKIEASKTDAQKMGMPTGEREKPEMPETLEKPYSMCTETPVISPDSKDLESGHGRSNRLFYGIFAVLSFLGMGGAFCVSVFYELTQQEQQILWGCAAFAGGCLLFSIWQIIRSFTGSRKQEQTKAEQITEYPADYGFSAMDMTDVLSKGMYRMEQDGRMLCGETSRSREEHLTKQEESIVECGDTVFFDRCTEMEYKLYATDAGNKEHIRLTDFPCTIGKMAGCADHVLQDDSVSRIHARLDKQGESIYLTDMNSMNGTYKNGLRIRPQETVEIAPGDEIRFGRLHYCFR